MSTWPVQQEQATDITHNSRRGDEQALINRRFAGDMASITGKCRSVAEAYCEEFNVQNKKIIDTEKNIHDAGGHKCLNVAEGIAKLQIGCTSQQRASEEMGAYLGLLVGERPAEG